MTNKTDWTVQYLRASIFPQIEKGGTIANLWPKLEGIELEKQTTEPKAGTTIYEGSYKKNKLILIATPVKIDLILTVEFPFKISEKGNEIMHLGIYAGAVKDFQSLFKQWISLDSFPPVKRLAFGADLVKEVSSHEDGYSLLSQYIPFSLDPKASDFSLRLNLPTISKAKKGLKINRISKWDLIKATAEISSINAPKIMREYSPNYMTHVELDINTDQENIEKFSDSLLLSLFSELIQEGEGISKKGVK